MSNVWLYLVFLDSTKIRQGERIKMYPKISPNNWFDHTFIHKDNKMVPAYDFLSKLSGNYLWFLRSFYAVQNWLMDAWRMHVLLGDL